MNHILLLAWRHFAARPARTATSVLGVGLGLATVLAVLTIDHNTILTQLRRSSVPPVARPDVEIRPLRPNPPDLAALRRQLAARTDLQSVTALFFGAVDLAAVRADTRRQDVRLCALEPGAGRAFEAYEIAAGDDLRDAEDLLVSEPIARELQLEPGDELEVARATPRVQGCVGGEIVTVGDPPPAVDKRTFRVAGILAPWNLGTQPVVVTGFDAALPLFAGAHVLPLFWGKLVSGAVYQDLRADLKDAFAVDKPKLALVGERVDQRAFRKGLRLSAFLSLFLGLFVIYNSFSMSLVERIKTIGLLRAMGLTARELNLVFLYEGLLVGILGVATGFALGAGLVWVMRELGITSLGYGKPLHILEIPWLELISIGALGLVSSLAGVVIPLQRASRLSVIEALRTGKAAGPMPHRGLRAGLFVLIASCLPLLYMLASPPLGENQRRVLFLVVIASALLAAMLAVLALFPAVALRALGALLAPTRRRFPLENRLAIASLGGAEQRVFASVTGLVLVFAGIFLISIVTDSLKAETERFVDRAVAGSVFVKSRPMAKADVVAAAARAGVPEIVSLAAQVQAPFLIRGVPSEVAARAVPALASPEALRAFDEGRSIVLSQLLARSFGYRSGDEVKLSTFTGPKSARVAAISDRLGFFPDDRAWAVMSSRAVHDFFCVDDTEGTNYVVTGGSSGDDCKTRLAEALGAGSVQWIHTGEEMRELYRDDMRHDFLIFDIILLLTVLLASAGMLNSFTIAILQRRREIGLLRAVGVTLRELRTILIMEALSMAVLGGVLALALGLPLAILSVRSIRILSLLDVPLRVSSSVLLLPIGGAVLVATVGCLLPLLRVARLDIAAATKYE